jgi:hypothetical protein
LELQVEKPLLMVKLAIALVTVILALWLLLKA